MALRPAIPQSLAGIWPEVIGHLSLSWDLVRSGEESLALPEVPLVVWERPRDRGLHRIGSPGTHLQPPQMLERLLHDLANLQALLPAHLRSGLRLFPELLDLPAKLVEARVDLVLTRQ
jgi:hypothetical protein